MERFPALALQLPRKSSGATIAERTEIVYVCEPFRKNFYESARPWLQGHQKRRLIFIEEDLERLFCRLHSATLTDALSDPQVIFAQHEGLEALMEKFPFELVEVFGEEVVSEKMLQKAALAHALHRDRFYGHFLFSNFVHNVVRLPQSFYANGLAKKFSGVPAIVCGAGPSLSQGISLLKKCENKALLVAGGSTLAALSAQGICPHFGIAVDPNPETYVRFKNMVPFETPLLFSTRVCPDIFKTISGPFGYMRSGIGGALEFWIEEALGAQEPLIGEDLSCEAMSVTAMCLAWAHFLGCSPILLHGVDLAYTDGRRYADGVLSKEFEPSQGGAENLLLKRVGRKGVLVDTALRWVMESSSFSQFAKKHPETVFLNTTEGGLGFSDIPYIPLVLAMDQFLTITQPLRSQVQMEIARSAMPSNSAEVIGLQMRWLRESLARVIEHLKVCAGMEAGSSALAEIELKEELAYRSLFYDTESVLEKEFGSMEPRLRWHRFLELAQSYSSVG